MEGRGLLVLAIGVLTGNHSAGSSGFCTNRFLDPLSNRFFGRNPLNHLAELAQFSQSAVRSDFSRLCEEFENAGAERIP